VNAELSMVRKDHLIERVGTNAKNYILGMAVKS
jgi:hypothetical protein